MKGSSTHWQEPHMLQTHERYTCRETNKAAVLVALRKSYHTFFWKNINRLKSQLYSEFLKQRMAGESNHSATLDSGKVVHMSNNSKNFGGHPQTWTGAKKYISLIFLIIFGGPPHRGSPQASVESPTVTSWRRILVDVTGSAYNPIFIDSLPGGPMSTDSPIVNRDAIRILQDKSEAQSPSGKSMVKKDRKLRKPAYWTNRLLLG